MKTFTKIQSFASRVSRLASLFLVAAMGLSALPASAVSDIYVDASLQIKGGASEMSELTVLASGRASGADIASDLAGNAYVEIEAAAPVIEPAITNVTARQRYPWNGKVDIAYTATNVLAAAQAKNMDVQLAVMAIDKSVTPWTTNVAEAACLFDGPRGARTLPLEDALSNGTHRIVWDMNAQGLTFASTNVDFVVSAEEVLPGVRLWNGGPSWATCNVGASKSEEYGYYFMWGSTNAYVRNTGNDGWVSVQDGSSFEFRTANCPTYNKSVDQLASGGYIDETGHLVAAHDAATVYFGDPWRMPTIEEIQALIDNCTTEWMTTNGVLGRLVTGKGIHATKSIFLPAAGYGNTSRIYNTDKEGRYRSSAPQSGNADSALGLNFASSEFCQRANYRHYGLSVRPLCGPAETLCAGESAEVKLDLATGTRIPAATETLVYSTEWDGGTSVALAVNGTTLASGLAGSGTYDWTPNGTGLFTLTHTTTTSSGDVVLTALFEILTVTFKPELVANTTMAVYTNGVAVAKTGDDYVILSNATATVVYTVTDDDYAFADGTTEKTVDLDTSVDPATVVGGTPAAPVQVWFSEASVSFDTSYTTNGYGNAIFVVTHPDQVLPVAYSTNNWGKLLDGINVSLLYQGPTYGPTTFITESVTNGLYNWAPTEGDYGRHNFGARSVSAGGTATNWLDGTILYTTNFNLTVAQSEGGTIAAYTNEVAAGNDS